MSEHKTDSKAVTTKTVAASLLFTPFIYEPNSANSWWGKAWHKNLESYAEFKNSSTNKCVVQAISWENAHKGDIVAIVQSTRKKPYEVLVRVQPLAANKWQQLVRICENKSYDSAALLAGSFSSELGEILLSKQLGIFPAPSEVISACTCPDWSQTCKHSLAVLYAMAHRFDSHPQLLFELRQVNIHEILSQSAESKLENLLKIAQSSSPRVLSDDYIEKLFKL